MEIHDLVERGEIERVRELLDADPDLINAPDEYLFTPLHVVASADDRETAEELLRRGADVNRRNDEGVTPLHLALSAGMVELFVRHGADVRAVDAKGYTVLHVLAEESSDLDALEAVLKAGCPADLPNNHGWTAAEIAEFREEPEKAALIRRYEPPSADSSAPVVTHRSIP